MKSQKVLLVEGADDQHVVWALLKRHNVPETFKVDDAKGVDKLLETFPVQLKGSEITSVGIVVDADADLSARWRSVRAALIRLNYTNCPENPPLDGVVLREENKPRFGVWFMPDNALPGMLEDFVAYLVPKDDLLWSYASDTVNALPAERRKFADRHRCKAVIHTWLAWQLDPGTPMGQAITKQYLNGNAEGIRLFLDWIDRLFVRE